MDRSLFFKKYVELLEGEKILAESGYQFKAYRNSIWLGVVVFSTQFLGVAIATLFTVVAIWMITYFKAEHVSLPNFDLLVTIFYCGMLPCFVLYFLKGAVENFTSLTREHTRFWFSRYIVTSERLVIITPEGSRNVFSPRLFVGSIAASDIADAREFFCDATKKELRFPKIVIQLRGADAHRPTSLEISGVEKQNEFLAIIRSLIVGESSQTGFGSGES